MKNFLPHFKWLAPHAPVNTSYYTPSIKAKEKALALVIDDSVFLSNICIPINPILKKCRFYLDETKV